MLVRVTFHNVSFRVLTAAIKELGSFGLFDTRVTWGVGSRVFTLLRTIICVAVRLCCTDLYRSNLSQPWPWLDGNDQNCRRSSCMQSLWSRDRRRPRNASLVYSGIEFSSNIHGPLKDFVRSDLPPELNLFQTRQSQVQPRRRQQSTHSSSPWAPVTW